MASLYELTEDYRELLAMAEDEELDSELLADQVDIQIDTREKQRAIRKIVKTFDDHGVKHFSSKLLVGDYMSLDNPRLIIDRKQSLQMGTMKCGALFKYLKV